MQKSFKIIVSGHWEEYLRYVSVKTGKISTDGWIGYKPLMKERPHFEQMLSNKGDNLKMLRIQINNLKNWLSVIHSYGNKEIVNQHIE
jgi:hypothetical protein